MAPAAAPCQSLHELAGMCEYCGEACDSTTDELNAINCTFEGCPSPEIYHQSCIEAYLKSIRLDKQRKTGFQCPRGCGKGSKWDKPCPGRVTKSHPIHARNDSSKKRRKAKQPDPAPQLPSPASTKKQAGLTKSKSVKSDKEKSPEVETEDCRVCPTPVKAQVLNRASTFPGGDKSSAMALSSSNGHGEAGAASADVKDGDGPFNGSKIGASYLEKCSDSGSAETSDSEDSSNASQMSTSAPSRDFKEVLAGPRYIPAPPVVNAWASGRPRNGDIALPQGKDQIPGVPPEIRPTSAQAASQSEPPNAKQVAPVSAEEASLLAEIDKQEERRKRAQGKNEKKHIRQVLAKLRERLDELRKSRATLSATATQISDEVRNSTASSDAVGKSMAAKLAYADGQGTLGKWSQNCINALRNRKAAAIVKQLQSLGFDDVRCNIAVQAAGISAHNCLEWLLRNATSIHANKPDLLPQGQPLDVSVELKQLDELLKSKDLTQDQIEVAIVNECGDVDAAMEQLKRGRSQKNGVASGPPRSSMPAAQVSAAASSSNGMPRSANPGNTGSVWDGSRHITTTASSVRPSHPRDLDFQNPNEFAGGDCISDLSMYNARVGANDQRTSPREVMSSLTSTRTSFSREGGRPPFALPRTQVPGSVEQYVNTMESSVATSSYSRLPASTPGVPPFSKSSMELVSNAFAPQVNTSLGPSRAVSGSGFSHPQSEHGQAMENGYSSFLSEPTASTVTSVTAAVLNDGEYDEQAIKESMARIPESQDLTESSIWNPRHESEIWGTQGLGAAGPSSSFYNSDTARRITASAAALSEAFSNGAALGSDSSSYGLNGRNGFTGGNWNSRLGLTQSFRNMSPAPGFGGASAQALSVGILNSDYSFAETEGWSTMSECLSPRLRNGYTRPAGLYDQTSLAYGDQQRHRQNGLNGVHSQAVNGTSYGRAATVGTPPGIWERHPLRAPVEEQDSLVNHLVGLLKGVEV